MAVTWTATGITASSDTATPFANLSYTLPTGHTTNDLLIAFYGGKPYNTVPSTPTDYVARSGGANGTTAMGSGTGSVYAIAFTKVHDGSESNPASTFSAQYSPGIRAMVKGTDSSGLGTWRVESCKGSDATATSTTYSATGDATLPLQAGDWLVALYVHNDDSSSSSAWALSVPGCSLGTVTQQLTGTLTTATGNDGRMYVVTAEVTSGTASGAPVATCTTGSGDSDGQTVFLMVRPPIAAGATATATADLTAEASVIASHSATAAPTATAALTSSATVLATHTATAALSTTASLTGGAVVVDATTGTLTTATASLTGAAVVVDATTAALSAAAALTSDATVVQGAVEAQAALSAGATLTGTAVVVDSGGMAVTASAALTASGVVVVPASSALSSTASLAASGTRSADVTATTTATAALTASAVINDDAEAVLDAVAELFAAGEVRSTIEVSVSVGSVPYPSNRRRWSGAVSVSTGAQSVPYPPAEHHASAVTVTTSAK